METSTISNIEITKKDLKFLQSLKNAILNHNQSSYTKFSIDTAESFDACMDLYQHCHKLTDMNDIDEIAEILFDSLHNHFFPLEIISDYDKTTDEEKEESFRNLDYIKSSNKLFTISQTILFLIKINQSVERIDFINRRSKKGGSDD